MELAIREKNNVKIMDLKGEVDLYSSPAIRKEFDGLIKKKERAILINLEKVSYIDSSGLATFIEAMQKISKYKGKLRLTGLRQSIKNVFEVARLDGVFSIFDNEAGALKSF
ncbi:MAG: STAS domain-containing protein [Candidatus Omnitrophota bacterium]|nr:STAS domain-containing protein [Candidatus Omnitrophota bacterium]